MESGARGTGAEVRGKKNNVRHAFITKKLIPVKFDGPYAITNIGNKQPKLLNLMPTKCFIRRQTSTEDCVYHHVLVGQVVYLCIYVFTCGFSNDVSN
jgi:hypothetical protein